MKFYIVDAFTDELFGGNPAGVVLLNEGMEFPNAEIMVKTAAEFRYSETVFIRKTEEKTFHFRYFTPVSEVDLCGHATVGAFGALDEAGLTRAGEFYEIETVAGRLRVKAESGFAMMEMGAPKELQKLDGPEDLKDLATAVGISVENICAVPQLISTGLPDIILEVESKELLMNLKADFSAISALSKKHEAVGVHVYASAEADSGVTAYCRNFAPLFGVDEESATGTANGALTYYLYLRNRIKVGDTNIFVQGESMGRPSEIRSELSRTGNSMDTVRIQVGGKSRIVAKGELFLGGFDPVE